MIIIDALASDDKGEMDKLFKAKFFLPKLTLNRKLEAENKGFIFVRYSSWGNKDIVVG